MLGRSLVAQGRIDDAKPLLQEGYAVLAHWPGPSHPYTVEASRALRQAAGRAG